MIFFPSYRARRASSFGSMPARRLRIMLIKTSTKRRGYIVRVFRDALGVHTHRAVRDGRDVSLHINAARIRDLVAAHAHTGRREVAGVGVRLQEPRSVSSHILQLRSTGRTWKQMRLAPSMPSRISLRRGRHRKISELGNGVCTNSPIAASGSAWRSSDGTSRRW